MDIKKIILKYIGFKETKLNINHKEVTINVSFADISNNLSNFLLKSEIPLTIGVLKFTSANTSYDDQHLLINLLGSLTLEFMGYKTVKDFNITIKTIPKFEEGKIYINNTTIYHIEIAGISYAHKDKNEVVKILELAISKLINGYEIINLHNYSTKTQNAIITSMKTMTLTEHGITCILDTESLTNNLKKVLILKLISLFVIILFFIGILIGLYTHIIQKIITYYLHFFAMSFGESFKEIGDHPVGTAVHFGIMAII